MIEFVLTFPLLLIIFVGTVEISNFVYANQKAQSAAENILNIINLQDDVSTPQLAVMAEMLPRIVRPFEVETSEYRVIVTAMQRDLEGAGSAGNFGYVHWQKEFGGAAGGSRFYYDENGTPLQNRVQAGALEGFIFFPGDQVLVVETYMKYEPILDIELMERMLGLRESLIYYVSPPSRPRSGKFQFHPDDLV